MTFNEAIALQPAWVGMWLNILLFGAFILPVSLLIWKQTRITAIITVVASVVGGMATQWLFGQMGYVKLLGLPHIITNQKAGYERLAKTHYDGDHGCNPDFTRVRLC